MYYLFLPFFCLNIYIFSSSLFVCFLARFYFLSAFLNRDFSFLLSQSSRGRSTYILLRSFPFDKHVSPFVGAYDAARMQRDATHGASIRLRNLACLAPTDSAVRISLAGQDKWQHFGVRHISIVAMALQIETTWRFRELYADAENRPGASVSDRDAGRLQCK